MDDDSFFFFFSILTNWPTILYYIIYFTHTSSWHFYDDKTYIDWVVDTGFKPISVKLVPTIMTYKERAGLSGWIRTTWHPYLDYLPEHKKHRFIQLVVDDVVNQVGVNSNGNLIIPMMRLEVIAVKGEIK